MLLMDTREAVYYICLNQHCPRHRNIFMEGNPQHEACDRERLRFEGERSSSAWMWLAVAVGVAGATAAATFLLTRALGGRAAKRRSLHEEAPTKTWSGAESHRDDRMSHRVPPPLYSAND